MASQSRGASQQFGRGEEENDNKETDNKDEGVEDDEAYYNTIVVMVIIMTTITTTLLLACMSYYVGVDGGQPYLSIRNSTCFTYGIVDNGIIPPFILPPLASNTYGLCGKFGRSGGVLICVCKQI